MKITAANIQVRLNAINALRPGYTLHKQPGLVGIVYKDAPNTFLRAKTNAALFDLMGAYLQGLYVGQAMSDKA